MFSFKFYVGKSFIAVNIYINNTITRLSCKQLVASERDREKINVFTFCFHCLTNDKYKIVWSVSFSICNLGEMVSMFTKSPFNPYHSIIITQFSGIAILTFNVLLTTKKLLNTHIMRTKTFEAHLVVSFLWYFILFCSISTSMCVCVLSR